jgi:2-keto-4-pentenoate hydratase
MRASRGDRVHRAAAWLARRHLHRFGSRPMPAAMAPRGLAEAYAVQDAFVALKARACGAVAGYKIALTTPQMRAMVGLHESIAGCLHARQVVGPPAAVRAGDYGRLLVEFEIGFRMAMDFPLGEIPLSLEEVAQAVGVAMPAFELADDLGADYGTLGSRGLELAADNAWNEGAVLGAPVRNWRDIDLAALRGVVSVNGREVGEGRGADALGHPLAALAWVANHLASRGRRLRKGDVVITGSLVRSQFPRAGDLLRFEAGPLGAVELRVT